MLIIEHTIKTAIDNLLQLDNISLIMSNLSLPSDLQKSILNYLTNNKIKVFVNLPMENFNNATYLPLISINTITDRLIDYPLGFGEQNYTISGSDLTLQTITGVINSDTEGREIQLTLPNFFAVKSFVLNSFPYNVYPFHISGDNYIIQLPVIAHSGDTYTLQYYALNSTTIFHSKNLVFNKSIDINILTDNELVSLGFYYILKIILIELLESLNNSIYDIMIDAPSPPAGLSQLLPATVYMRVIRCSFNIVESVPLNKITPITQVIFNKSVNI